MAEARGAGRPGPFEDRHTWRLLLARLHPDAGGDHNLFTFACAVREELCSEGPSEREPARRRERRAESFLQSWQDAMGCWASRNRDSLK